VPIVVARTFTVSAAARSVLDYLTDFAHTVEWDPATRRATRADPGPIAVGSRWHTEARVLGVGTHLTYTLCAATADRLVFAAHSEVVTATDTITVRPAGDGAEVTYAVEVEVHGVAKLATPVLKGELERLATETARRLTDTLNQRAAQAR
jgi:hypothetical protein